MIIVHRISKTGDQKIQNEISLSDRQFIQLAEKIEEKAKSDFQAYKKELLIFAVIAYAYIALILALLIGLGVYSVLHLDENGMDQITFFLVLFVIVIIKSLWVKFDFEEGIELEREKFPALFSLLDEVCEKLNTRVDTVLLNTDFNASVYQKPRAGILGLDKHYLNLGLPFMMAQDKEAFKATLAHEFGHLSANHSRSAEWIYYLRQRWSQLFDKLDSRNVLFYPFFRWYEPRFKARSLVMSRKHEVDADLSAIQIAGADACSRRLVVSALKGRYLSEIVWSEIYRRTVDLQEPVSSVYTTVKKDLSEFSTSKLKYWLIEELNAKDDKRSTHPTFKERLNLCNKLSHYENISPEELELELRPLPPGESSAEIYLNERLPDLIESVSEEWKKENTKYWNEKYEAHEKHRSELNELNEKEKSIKLNSIELKKKAQLLQRFSRKEEVFETYKEILRNSPNDAAANYFLGKVLLEAPDKSFDSRDALYYLRRSYQYDVGHAESAKSLILQYFCQEKKYDQISSLSEDSSEIEIALDERISISENVEFLSHDLPTEYCSEIYKWAEKNNSINAVYLVRKKVIHFPESEHYCLGFSAIGCSEEYKKYIAELACYDLGRYLGTITAISISDGWENKFKQTPNSLILKR